MRSQTNDPYTIVGGRTLSSLLADGTRRHGDRPLLVFEGSDGETHTATWADLGRQSLAVADLLASKGVRRGDRVHLHLSNRPEFFQVWFACAHLGAVMVPTNTASSVDELHYIIGHSEARLSVTEAVHRDRVTSALVRDGAGSHLLVAEELGSRSPDASREYPTDVRPDDDLAVLYTSGTTARPKGVRLTHANYVYAGEVVARSLRVSANDRLLVALPLFHGNAQYYSTMSALVARATIVLLPRFSASRYLIQAARHEATIGSLFAAPIRMILRQAPQSEWRASTLRVLLFAQNLTDEEVRQWSEITRVPLVQLYGMTETVGPPLINPLDGEGRENSIGRPVLGYFCRVLREDGSPADVGEPGQLAIHGLPSVTLMRGYLNDPEATDAALRDGWLHTGDVVRVDEDGFFYFVDRRKDLIKRAGENVAASEVEHALLSHPEIVDAAVVGIPDPVRDEQIVAFVVPRDGITFSTEEIIRWCRDRLADFRVPSIIEVRDELPRTAVGKVQKHVLRSELLSSLQGCEEER